MPSPERRLPKANYNDYEQKLLDNLNTKQNTCEYGEDINLSPMLRKLNDEAFC